MKANIRNNINDENEVGSTNFIIFVNRFENADATWIDEVNTKIDSVSIKI